MQCSRTRTGTHTSHRHWRHHGVESGRAGMHVLSPTHVWAGFSHHIAWISHFRDITSHTFMMLCTSHRCDRGGGAAQRQYRETDRDVRDHRALLHGQAVRLCAFAVFSRFCNFVRFFYVSLWLPTSMSQRQRVLCSMQSALFSAVLV